MYFTEKFSVLTLVSFLISEGKQSFRNFFWVRRKKKKGGGLGEERRTCEKITDGDRNTLEHLYKWKT